MYNFQLSMVDDITQYIKNELDIEVKYNTNETFLDIILRKQDDIYAFQEWLYKNATVYLKRKYDKFAVLRQDCEKSQDDQSGIKRGRRKAVRQVIRTEGAHKS